MRHLRIIAAALWATSIACFAQTTSWADFGVVGKRFELIHETSLVVYRFGPDHVTATLGQKKGYAAGPILYYRIEGNQLIISSKPDGPSDTVLVLVDASENEVSARGKSGELLKFKVTKWP